MHFSPKSALWGCKFIEKHFGMTTTNNEFPLLYTALMEKEIRG